MRAAARARRGECVAPPIAQTYRPQPASADLLGARLERYRRMHRALKGEFVAWRACARAGGTSGILDERRFGASAFRRFGVSVFRCFGAAAMQRFVVRGASPDIDFLRCAVARAARVNARPCSDGRAESAPCQPRPRLATLRIDARIVSRQRS
ncbi:hypothetical protein WS73_04540 [Burkholderia savannae]|nr:hypothetical protein WS73_04540 [Burkholderia savannae]